MKTFAEIQKKAAKLKTQLVKIAAIVCRQDTQLRDKTSAVQIATYRGVYQGDPLTDASGRLMRDKETKAFVYKPKAERMPPIMVAPAADWTTDDPDANPEQRFYIIDGDHRATAAARAGLEEINAVILPAMTLNEARFAAVGANADHGLARTNKDKQNSLKVTCELSTNLTASCNKSKKTKRWGKVTYKGTLPNGEKVTARALAAIAGVSHEAAAAYLKANYASQFQNKQKPEAAPETPSGNASGDADGGTDPVDEIRDLTSTDASEYAHSLIAGASQDIAWIETVAETLFVWVENQRGDEEEVA